MHVRAQADESLQGAVIMGSPLQATLGHVVVLLRQLRRVLARGSPLVLVVPNAESLRVGARDVWQDPAARRPVSPRLYAQVVELAGFTAPEIRTLRWASTSLSEDVADPRSPRHARLDASLRRGVLRVIARTWLSGRITSRYLQAASRAEAARSGDGAPPYAPAEQVEALRDVSFAIEPGSSFGVVGANGSGKSTLLKLLAGTAKPTSGTLEVNGRVTALLEIGAGFHPDFSGRENAYLNGSLLGLSRKEMDRAMPAIEEFADIGRFFDAAVKTYSSGMYMRLGFAVAVHLEPDILLVDEVLAG